MRLPEVSMMSQIRSCPAHGKHMGIKCPRCEAMYRASEHQQKFDTAFNTFTERTAKYFESDKVGNAALDDIWAVLSNSEEALALLKLCRSDIEEGLAYMQMKTCIIGHITNFFNTKE